MIVTGIIVEYNPFHNGHVHHINQARTLTNCDILVAIMSPTFMQRGEPAIINKYERAKAAVLNGVDIVIELPSIYAINSANHFAYGAIDILKELNIDYLVFGSESDDVDLLVKAATLSMSQEYQNALKMYVKQGIRYANACNLAFNDLGMPSISQSNDILALAYVNEIVRHNYNIKPIAIQRTNEFLNEEITGHISSATSIRKSLLNQKDISTLTPMSDLLSNNNQLVFFNDYFDTLKYLLNTLETKQINIIKGFDEGLEYLFKKHINNAKNMDDFINLCSSKRYPKTRIQRLITYLLVNLTKEDNENIKVDYIRLLAMNKEGQKAIKHFKKQSNYDIISNYSKKKSNALLFEKKVTFVYSCANKYLDYLNDKEYKENTMIIEKVD